MSCSRLVFACLVTLFAAACDNATSLGPLVPFSRPEHIAFACFAPLAGSPQDRPDFEVLPQECCAARYDGSVCSTKQRADGTVVPLGPPRLHALVTQSTRGEVAAVDMTESRDDRVLDSDSLIPGYTFLDSGGLPSAVVMPEKQPRAAGKVGAKYAFVASAEEHNLRAIAACRFRSGRSCGPEDDARKAGVALPPRQIVALPAAPGDMILGPEPDEALYVSLPELALIARIELAGPEDAPYDAFAIDPATGRPKAPQFFRVPAVASVSLPEPIAEPRAYYEVCGLSVPYAPRDSALPIAPRANPAALRPKLLRYDATSKLLLVADVSAPVIHAFTLLADGTPSPVGALPTGAPIRDFALTEPVAEVVPRERDGQIPLALASVLAEAEPSVRYLYAVDDRDGSVMVFRYRVDDAGGPQLTPLRAPVPNQRFADRLDVGEPVSALDVIDTRGDSDLRCGAAYDPTRPGTLDDYNRGMADLRAKAGPRALRGVFVALASENGLISLLDVLDLDLTCRAETECKYSDPSAGVAAGLEPRRERTALAVRRHAARRNAAGPLFGTTNNPGLFVGDASCAPFVAVGPGTCAPADPWLMQPDNYSVQYQPALPGASSPSGSLSAVGDYDLELKAPVGLDLCGRGVQPRDLVSLSAPITDARKQSDPCGSIGGDDRAGLLSVEAAYRDRLVLRPGGITDDERRARRNQLSDCFPDFVQFEVRAADFLVFSSSTYLSNVVADPQSGACVIDRRRPELTSRAAPNARYQSPYLSFQLVDNARTLTSTGANLSLTQGSSALTDNLVTGTFTDVLPATLRYYPGRNEFYVVDSASQGLTRYTVSPFDRDD